MLPAQYAWFEPVLIATIVVFIIDLVGSTTLTNECGTPLTPRANTGVSIPSPTAAIMPEPGSRCGDGGTALCIKKNTRWIDKIKS